MKKDIRSWIKHQQPSSSQPLCCNCWDNGPWCTSTTEAHGSDSWEQEGRDFFPTSCTAREDGEQQAQPWDCFYLLSKRLTNDMPPCWPLTSQYTANLWKALKVVPPGLAVTYIPANGQKTIAFRGQLACCWREK